MNVTPEQSGGNTDRVWRTADIVLGKLMEYGCSLVKKYLELKTILWNQKIIYRRAKGLIS